MSRYVLPQAPAQFSQQEEMRFRDALNKALRDIESNLENVKRRRDKVSSLAARRAQFLLMGMRNG